MRLDLFLKASRLCQRRAVAQKLCDAGLVFVNDKPAKSAHPVNPGDGVTIRYRNQVTKIQVMSLPSAHQTSRTEANTLYKVLSEEPLPTPSLRP